MQITNTILHKLFVAYTDVCDMMGGNQGTKGRKNERSMRLTMAIDVITYAICSHKNKFVIVEHNRFPYAFLSSLIATFSFANGST